MDSKTKYLDLFGPMINAIKTRIRLHAVVLFGSRAREDANAMSDYDIIIIADFKDSYNERYDWVIQLAPLVSLDLFCFTPNEFDRLFENLNLTAIDAIGEGIVLFGDDFIEPYEEKYKTMTANGMRKTDCLVIPPRKVPH